MKLLLNKPLDQSLSEAWSKVDPAYKRAFFIVLGVNLLAFGFEMTNLTLHHDDVSHIFIQSTILGHYLGRFGFGWLHYYGQNAYIMPFLQMVEGIMLMSAFGMLVSKFWGARKVLDIVLISSVLCVFPYMAQLYQYNTSIAAFSMAHFLAAAAVILSTRATFLHVGMASLLYVAAFSIYQSVIANAATIFCVWGLSKILFENEGVSSFIKSMAKPAAAAFGSVVAGGLIYVAIVSTMDLKFDSYQSAGQAFSLKGGRSFSYAISEVVQGTRSFFFWPQHYFPAYLKIIQLLFLVISGFFCLWLPKGPMAKASAVLILALALFMPRILQLLHPEGNYHNLTLTGYAVLIAGFVMIINRAGQVLVRNLSILLTLFLIAGYTLQSNWISTVNHLNMLAHYTTMTQILTRIKSLPSEKWDGMNVAVVGNLNMSSSYPFRGATGVATKFINAPHMQHLARLMREDINFVAAGQAMPKVMEYSGENAQWPHSSSVGIVDGMGVVVLSKDKVKTSANAGVGAESD